MTDDNTVVETKIRVKWQLSPHHGGFGNWLPEDQRKLLSVFVEDMNAMRTGEYWLEETINQRRSGGT